jgi:hypothetical protein
MNLESNDFGNEFFEENNFGISGRIKESHEEWYVDKWYKFWTLRRVRVIDDFEVNSIDITGGKCVYVKGKCREGFCECDYSYNGANPEEVGYPPYHEDCDCIILV